MVRCGGVGWRKARQLVPPQAARTELTGCRTAGSARGGFSLVSHQIGASGRRRRGARQEAADQCEADQAVIHRIITVAVTFSNGAPAGADPRDHPSITSRTLRRRPAGHVVGSHFEGVQRVRHRNPAPTHRERPGVLGIADRDDAWPIDRGRRAPRPAPLALSTEVGQHHHRSLLRMTCRSRPSSRITSITAVLVRLDRGDHHLPPRPADAAAFSASMIRAEAVARGTEFPGFVAGADGAGFPHDGVEAATSGKARRRSPSWRPVTRISCGRSREAAQRSTVSPSTTPSVPACRRSRAQAARVGAPTSASYRVARMGGSDDRAGCSPSPEASALDAIPEARSRSMCDSHHRSGLPDRISRSPRGLGNTSGTIVRSASSSPPVRSRVVCATFALAADYDGTLAPKACRWRHGRGAAPPLGERPQADPRHRAPARRSPSRLPEVTASTPSSRKRRRPEPARSQETRVLAPPPSARFIEALRSRGVGPVWVGQVVVATVQPNETP